MVRSAASGGDPMSPVKTLLVCAGLVLAWLALLLGTHEVGLTADMRPVSSVEPEARWQFLLEDLYDRQAYLARGRWVASGGTPYLEEFSEYPQLTTWILGVPYLFFDHGVTRGEPFGSVGRARDHFVSRGVSELTFERMLDALVDHGAQSQAYRSIADRILRRADEQGGRDEAEALLFAARDARLAVMEETERNFRPYSDGHHVSMALWYLALLAVQVGLLRTLGLSPAWVFLWFLPGTLYFGFNRSDLPVTTFLALALLLQLRARPLGAATAIAFAGMCKWFPLFLAPMLFAYGYRTHVERIRRSGGTPSRGALAVRELLAPAALTGAICLAILGVTWVWDGGGLEAVRFLVDWHLEREHNHSSLVAILCHPDGYGVFPPKSLDTWKDVFLVLQLLPPFLLALLPLRTPPGLLQGALLGVAGMALFSKFFSPQWIVWLFAVGLPLLPTMRRYLVLLVALQLVIYLQLPVFVYEELEARLAEPYEGAFWVVTNVRIALFAAIWLCALAGVVLASRRAADATDSAQASQ